MKNPGWNVTATVSQTGEWWQTLVINGRIVCGAGHVYPFSLPANVMAHTECHNLHCPHCKEDLTQAFSAVA